MRKGTSIYKFTCILGVLSLLAGFLLGDILRVKSTHASVLGLPEPTQMLNIGAINELPILKGLKINPKNPLDIDFLVDGGDSSFVDKKEINRLINYFLAALTVPDENLWVNLSPYEKDRIMNDDLSKTDLGRDMMGQDYILKQLASSLTDPDTALGKAYWNLENRNSKNEIRNVLNKIWISPAETEVFAKDNVVFVTEAVLKVHSEDGNELLIPQITKEVNQGEHFAKLRQIYNSLILAKWFKQKFTDSAYKQYMNQNKIDGIELDDKKLKQKIYSLYTEAFKRGVYEKIKKETEPSTNKKQKRRYFSGGCLLGGIAPIVSSSVTSFEDLMNHGDLFFVDGGVDSLASSLVVNQFTFDPKEFENDTDEISSSMSQKKDKKPSVSLVNKLIDKLDEWIEGRDKEKERDLSNTFGDDLVSLFKFLELNIDELEDVEKYTQQKVNNQFSLVQRHKIYFKSGKNKVFYSRRDGWMFRKKLAFFVEKQLSKYNSSPDSFKIKINGEKSVVIREAAGLSLGELGIANTRINDIEAFGFSVGVAHKNNVISYDLDTELRNKQAYTQEPSFFEHVFMSRKSDKSNAQIIDFGHAFVGFSKDQKHEFSNIAKEIRNIYRSLSGAEEAFIKGYKRADKDVEVEPFYKQEIFVPWLIHETFMLFPKTIVWSGILIAAGACILVSPIRLLLWLVESKKDKNKISNVFNGDESITTSSALEGLQERDLLAMFGESVDQVAGFFKSGAVASDVVGFWEDFSDTYFMRKTKEQTVSKYQIKYKDGSLYEFYIYKTGFWSKLFGARYAVAKILSDAGLGPEIISVKGKDASYVIQKKVSGELVARYKMSKDDFYYMGFTVGVVHGHGYVHGDIAVENNRAIAFDRHVYSDGNKIYLIDTDRSRRAGPIVRWFEKRGILYYLEEGRGSLPDHRKMYEQGVKDGKASVSLSSKFSNPSYALGIYHTPAHVVGNVAFYGAVVVSVVASLIWDGLKGIFISSSSLEDKPAEFIDKEIEEVLYGNSNDLSHNIVNNETSSSAVGGIDFEGIDLDQSQGSSSIEFDSIDLDSDFSGFVYRIDNVRKVNSFADFVSP